MNLAQMLVNNNKPEVSGRTLMALRRSMRLPQQTSNAGGNLDNAGGGGRFIFKVQDGGAGQRRDLHLGPE